MEEDEMGKEKCTECWWGNVRERDHLEDLSVEGSILKWILQRYRIG
jgi:hypothetical protein